MPKPLHLFCLVSAVVFAAAGCRRGGDDSQGHDHGAGGDHEHEAKTAQITVWTGRYEVFAEHQSPVVDTPVTFITHVTDLHTLEPRTEGMVKFILRQGTEVFEHPQAAPARAGIYLPAITFPKTGGWQATLLVPDGTTNASVDLGVIHVYTDKHSAAHAEVPDGPEGVSFLKEQQWKILSKAEPVTKRRLVERVRATALVTARPGSLAHISPPMAGKLQPPPGAKFPLPGDRVTAGQTLALLQPAFSEATAKLGETEGAIHRARFAVAQAKRDYERALGLFESKVETERNVELAKLALDSAEAELIALLATQTSYRQGSNTASGLPVVELKSPIAGVVVSMDRVALGQHVSAERTVFTVLDAASVFIEARVPESEATRVGGATNALIEFSGHRGEFLPLTGEGRGRLIFASPHVDPATHTLALLYETPNLDGRFRVGEHLTVFIESNRAEEAVAIPDSAIVEEGGQPIAFVQVSGETFEKRELTLGLRDGAFVQILRGVKEGERIVTKGAMAIRLARVSNVIPAHGHVH